MPLTTQYAASTAMARGNMGSFGNKVGSGGASRMIGRAGGVAGDVLGGMPFDAAENLATLGNESYRTALLNQRNNEATGLSAEAGIAGHYHNQMSSGLRSASDRTMAQANFSAAESNYNAMNDFAQQRSARFAVLGAPPGMIAPDKRPEDAMGMAMHSMLDAPGRQTGKAAQFFNPSTGMFRQEANKSRAGLTDQFGFNAIQAHYTPSATPAEQFVESYKHGATMAMRTGFGAEDTIPAKQNRKKGESDPDPTGNPTT